MEQRCPSLRRFWMCRMGLLDVLTEAIPNMMPGRGDTVDCNGRSVAVRKVWRASRSFMIIWRTCIEDIFANVGVLFACVLVVFWFTESILVKCSLWCRSSHISRHCACSCWNIARKESV